MLFQYICKYKKRIILKNKLYLGLFLLIPVFFSCVGDRKSDSQNIRDCLVGYDWCQPNCENPIMAWKFAAEGTFNYSTTMFEGMAAWGNWKDVGNGEIEIIYTRTSTGEEIPQQTLIMPACNLLKVGSTIYKR